VLALAFGIQGTWRAVRAARRKADQLTGYALQQAEQIQAAAERLNQHGFDLQHTSSTFLPKLERIARVLQAPLVAVSLPWLLRRLFGRPLKKRHWSAGGG
jgi:hypothetical protein